MNRRNAQERWTQWAGCGALALAACATTACAQHFALKDGDTVVFYGDSITAQRLYTRDVEEFVLTRYPALHVRFVNAGVPGDRVNGGYAGTMAERVERDVAPFHPTMITVMLGMNDGGWGYGPSDIDATFQQGYRTLLEALHKAAPGAALTLICPTPYDEITHGTEFPGYARVINRFADDVSGIAAQLQAEGDKDVGVADMNRSMTDALERATQQFPHFAPLIVPDRIHPSETGQWIMAAALMSAWHVDPIVSSLVLNAADAQVIDKHHTTVTKVDKSAGDLTWTQLDDALPLPLDFNNAMTPMLLKISDLAQLDQMILRIASLDPGQYELSIDGKAVASFSRDELQRGVNLALLKTPMLDQARDIDSQEGERMTLDQARFILGADLKPSATSGPTEDRLWQAEDDIAASIRKDLDPKPHHFELRRK
ncbi:MAG: SGNH/GDSL hydrolase family protein [Terracidiphilus sp.]